MLTQTTQVQNIPEATGLWCAPPKNLVLGCDEVHVWRAALDAEPLQVQRMRHILSTKEQMRAGRFHFPKDRDRFIVAHGLLRTIIGRYLNAEPSQLRFCYGPYGKPGLGGASLRFNMSHSNALALYAIARNRNIGVDLECVRSELADERVAERFFLPTEVGELRALAPKLRPPAFFKFWTRKEAYIKARGEGLTLPLDQFEVSLAPGEQATLLRTDGEPSCWSLRELSPGAGYTAALAVKGQNWRLQCWQWES